MIRRQKVLHAIIDNWDDGASDEEHFGQNADAADIIITPPDVIDALSDNEELDYNVQLLRDEVELPLEIAGQFEVECVYDDQNEHIPTVCDDDMDVEEGDMSSTSSGRSCTSASRKAQKRPRIVEGMNLKWSRRKNYKFVPKDDTPTSYKALYKKIGAMNPI
ncbi:hypothetical protein ACLKA6_000436 [Drosophila palustris]